MGAARGTTCPDCGVPLQPIKLVDATERVFGEGAYRVNLTYAAQDAEAPWGGFLGGIQPTGDVYGRICPKCGRILLYAVPMTA
jgi:hypothetical protein